MGEEKHLHEHEHDEEIHTHKHKHGAIPHSHPHFHEPLKHVHEHEHPTDLAHTTEAHAHEHVEEHEHVHTYSFERYAHLNSPIHQLDPRIKFVTLLVLIVTIVLTSPLQWEKFVCYLGIVIGLLLLAKLPFSFVLKRSLLIIPFVLLIAIFAPFIRGGAVSGSYNLGNLSISKSGLLILWNALIKAWLSVLVIIILSTTTKFPNLLKGLERLKMPAIIIALLSFMYRFAYLFTEQIASMRRAHDSRNLGGMTKRQQIKVIGNMIGSLFIRSYERGENLYSAMSSRGFDGSIRTLDTLRLTARDILFASFVLLILVLIQLKL